MPMKIFEQIKDWSTYRDSLKVGYYTYDQSYQKCYEDEKRKKYFINIDHYNAIKNIPEGFTAHSQFNLSDQETFNVEYFISKETTLEMVEQFYETLWRRMNCLYYSDLY